MLSRERLGSIFKEIEKRNFGAGRAHPALNGGRIVRTKRDHPVHPWRLDLAKRTGGTFGMASEFTNPSKIGCSCATRRSRDAAATRNRSRWLPHALTPPQCENHLVIGRSSATLFLLFSFLAAAQPAKRHEILVRVLDDNNDPIQGLWIGATPTSPEAPFLNIGFPSTNDLGECTLGLPDGKYYISAIPIGSLDQQPEIHTDGTPGDPFIRTYYPSAAQKELAVPVVLAQDTVPAAPLVIRMLRQPTASLPVLPPIDQNSASLSGVVINQSTGAPLPHVHISLWTSESSENRPTLYYGAITKFDGTFSIAGMPPGPYGGTINRTGFVSPSPCCTLTLQAAEHNGNFKLALIPAGVITGRVSGPEGKPAQDIELIASGKMGRQTSSADSQGRFRIGGLSPGRYKLEASPLHFEHPSKQPNPPAKGAPPTRFIPTSFPVPVEVAAGTEVAGIEIQMTQAPVTRIRGRVTGVPPGTGVTLTLNGRLGGFSDILKPDGTFTWWDIDPGEYVVRAWDGIGIGSVHVDGSPVPNSAAMTISVAQENIDNIELRPRPPFQISGRVAHEGPAPQPLSIVKSLHLQGDQGGYDVNPSSDGHFNLKSVPPGRYQVKCDCNSSAYVKSLSLDAISIEGDILDLADGPENTSLIVLLSSRFAAISGTVQGDHSSLAGRKVALVPIGPAYNEQPRFAEIDSSGRYSFDSVIPANYKLAAVDEAYIKMLGADGLDLYKPGVKTVTLLPNQQTTLNLSTLRP